MLRPNVSVVRLRRVQSGEDRYGEPVYQDVETLLPDAFFAPGGSSEPVEVGRAPVVMEPTLYWRNEWPDVASSDRLLVRGRVFGVEGEPADWVGGRGGGLVVQLRAVEERGA